MPKPTYTLYTTPFEIKASLSQSNACGGLNTSKKFMASVQVKSSRLSSRNFVVEASHMIQTIKDYFAQASYFASCEQLAGCITRLVHDLVEVEVPVLEIEVVVFSTTGHIAMKWRAGDDLPKQLTQCHL